MDSTASIHAQAFSLSHKLCVFDTCALPSQARQSLSTNFAVGVYQPDNNVRLLSPSVRSAQKHAHALTNRTRAGVPHVS